MSAVSGPGVVIAGGGLAAQRCAETLRKRGYEDPIRIVCAEDEAPYDRPPLSKDVAAGTADGASVRFREAAWYDDNEVELVLGRSASGLDFEARELLLDDGSRLRYDELVIATGAAPRMLPALARFENAFPLRTLADAGRLREALAGGSHLVVVGAGFIGQEVAATARRQGVEVTIVEALDVPLAGVLDERVGRWIADLHREEGVRVLTGAMLASAAGNGRVEELTLADGGRLACDAVVVGVGVAPAAGWVEGSGLDPAGIATDAAGPDRDPARLGRGRRLPPLRPAPVRPRPDRALGRGEPPGRRRRDGDRRRDAARPGTAELLERPVRAPDPVRRPCRGRRRSPDLRRARRAGLPRPLPACGPARGRAHRQPAARACGPAAVDRERRTRRRRRDRYPRLTRTDQRGGTEMTLIPTIDEGACSAHGDCVAIAPTAFALEETAVVIGPATDEELVAAAEACPALAITLTDADTGQVVFP